MASEIKVLAIVGAGFMGSQIASRAAIFGYNVRMFDISPEALTSAKESISLHTAGHYQQEGVQGSPEDALSRITFHDTLAETVRNADLIIEVVPEKLKLKKEVFSQIDKLAPPHAIIGTNSSSIPVSKIEDAVTRKDKVVNIHFYTPLTRYYFVDIMKGSKTGDETFYKAKGWVESLECLPLVVKKECMGFVFNRIWHAVKKDALASWAGGHADFRDIDRAWRIWTGLEWGPFGAMDVVGLDVVYDIEMSYYNDSGDPKDKPPEALKDMIDRGELGMKSGKGFYAWPNAEFLRPDFIKGGQKR
jgi:3-hydroxybutyryl-CoA dehydrogenase